MLRKESKGRKNWKRQDEVGKLKRQWGRKGTRTHSPPTLPSVDPLSEGRALSILIIIV